MFDEISLKLSQKELTFEYDRISLEVKIQYGVLVKQKKICEKHQWFQKHPKRSGKSDANKLNWLISFFRGLIIVRQPRPMIIASSQYYW